MFKKLLQLKTLLVALLVMTGAGNAWAETVTFEPSDFSGQGTSGTGSAISATKDGVTFACNKGYGTTQLRCYSGAKITISSSNTITAISFTFSSSSYTGGLNTSYTGLSATTWVKNLSSQARITKVTVTYSASTSACATPTISPATGTYTSAQYVTISTTTDGATIYYTTDGTDPTTSSSVYTEAIPVSTTTTIKAMAAKEGMANSTVATAVVTVTVTDSEPKDIFYKVTDAGQLRDGNKIAIVSEGYNVAMSTTQNTNNRGETEITIENDSFERTNDVQVITLKHLDINWRLYTGSGYLYAASSSSNQLKTQAQGDANENSIVSIAIDGGDASLIFQGEYTRNVLQYNSNSNLFSCYGSASQKSIQIYRQELPLSVSSAGYATFSSTSALDFTNVVDINAYTASVNGNTISFKRVKKVPAKTGLLLRSVNEGPVSTTVPSLTSATDDVTDNAFVAATEEIDHLPTTTTDGKYTNYILYKPSDGIIGFYQANNQRVGAGKAYLHVSSEQATTRAFIAFSFDDPETGIAQIETLPQQGVAYDLQGRRVNAPKGGLYIINGKKVIVK